jgi:hypothetical protein
MRGDFSRLRFEQTKHYTSVLEQQGRVVLDADRNEQRAIDEHIRGTETLDIVGPFGGPKDDPGFAITFAPGAIGIGAGRYYVNGTLCENESPGTYGTQRYLINPAVSEADLIRDLSTGRFDSVRFVLEVWHRLVTVLDDPCLREPALGQADTTARRQTVWRVIAEPVLNPRPVPSPVAPASSALVANPSVLSRAAVVTSGAATALDAAPVDCCVQMYQPVFLPAAGKLSAQTTGGSSDCSCEPTPSAGYRGLENQLYRIEIHTGGTEATATFKWSRENGSVVSAVLDISGADVLVDTLGPDANLGFQPGQWVELSDDSYLFGPSPNQPGELFQIKSISQEHRTITMMTPVAQIDTARNARLRRWEQFGTSATAHGVPLTPGTWIDLENGIQVQFAPGAFQSGDYWLIPARTATGQIEWPPCGGDGAFFQEPHRTIVHRAPLACAHFDTRNQGVVVEDCRRLFSSLTEMNPAALSPAIHVTKINWANDDILTFDQLIQNGLVVSVDQTVTGRVDSGNFAVSLEVARGEAASANPGLAAIVLRSGMPLDGVVTLQPSSITWALPSSTDRQTAFSILQTINLINSLLLQGIPYSTYARVRVSLPGEKISGGSAAAQLFLDGQSFATPGTRSDGATPRTDLQFPSGDSQKASVFESWFYLAPILQLTSLTVTPNAVPPSSPVPPKATLTVNYPPLADTVVQLSVIPPSGAAPVVGAPPTITVLKGAKSAQFDVSIGDTLGAVAETFEIVATLFSNIGLPSIQTTTISVSVH